MANIYDIYQMFENGITLKSGVYLTPSDIQEMERIYRIRHGIWSYEFVKENVEEAERDTKMAVVTDHSADFYEGIYNTMQESITGDDEYDIVTRACKEESK